MRRHRPSPPTSTFRGAGVPLASGIVMLALVYALIQWTGNADNWRWLVQKPPAKGPGPRAAAPAPPLPKATGATDEDPDQAETAREEFQAVTDGTTKLGAEEMVPYNRLVFWVKNQSFARLDRCARHGLWYTDLYDQPDKYRGKLVALDLDIRRAKDVGENEHGVKLYEVWGVTPESRSRLYDLIVLDYPKDMPQGYDIRESVRFAGYFLKLQGYEPAGARPGQRPEKAPLLIGRLEWASPAAPPAEESEQWLWGGGATALLVAALVALAGLAIWFVYRRRHGRKAPPAHRTISSSGDVIPIDRWLEERGLNADDEEE